MARFNMNEADNYGNSGNGGSYFSLKNDKDVAAVRFLYNNADDIEGYAVHEIKVGDRERYVNCLRKYNQPVDDCPFCAARMQVKAKLFVPLYNEDTQQVQVWERGKKFFAQISGVCARYGSKHPIVSQIFEIERSGKTGDQGTTYNIYRTEDPADDKTLEDFEMPEVLGYKVLDKTAEEMEYYLENGDFPAEGSTPIRRGRRQEVEEDDTPRRATRRTPASRRNDEAF